MDEIYKITDAKYIKDFNGNNNTVVCTFNGDRVSVPMDTANRHYQEILRQVADGRLTIADAD